MYESHHEMLLVQRETNRARGERARAFAETTRESVHSVLTGIFLLEAWMHSVYARMEDVLRKDPSLSMHGAVTKAIAGDTADRAPRNPEKEFGELAR